MNADPGHITYDSLNQNIINGIIKVPQFQREFVWNLEETAGLIDSIIKGYPIGTFIIWKTRERLKSIRNIGDIDFPDSKDGDMVQYVLDGQQRITSIFVSLNGIKNQKGIDYSNIYIDLEANFDDRIVITDISEKDPSKLIKVVSLLNAKITDLLKYDNIDGALEKIQNYRDAIKTYQFSTVTVENAPLDVATEIFTRINVHGKTLNKFEIMVAKTYDENREFDLAEKFDKLKYELSASDYDTISSSAVLQSISLCLKHDVKGKVILSLGKDEFINAWEPVTNAIKSAVDYFRMSYGVPVSQLLPYDALLILFTYYFYKHPERPIGDQQLWLKDFFWRATLTERYSNSVDTKINSDAQRIDMIIDNLQPTFDMPVDLSKDYLKIHGSFTTNSAYIKGMLCLFASLTPLSFIDNNKITIDNGWLKQSNSKNYHHFFPKAFMKKFHPEIDYSLVNHIVNITIVDEFLNKSKIRDRAPSDYIKDFSHVNSNLSQTLNSHLIEYNENEDFGIDSDDYLKFFDKRLKKIIKEIKTKIVITKNDRI